MRVELRNVVPGTILDAPVIKDGVLLVKKGGELTPALINRLLTFGINSVDIVSEQRMSQASKNNRKTEETNIDVSEGMEFTVSDNFTNNIREALLENDIEKIEDNASTMVDAIMESIDLNGSFTNFKYDLQAYNKDVDPLDHSIRVAAFSIVLAHLYNEQVKKDYSSQETNEMLVDLNDVAVAALLHDRGRNCYGESTLKNIEVLANNAELRENLPGLAEIPLNSYDDKYIPVYSFSLINSDERISNRVKMMILYSSEMENGNGPLRAKDFDKYNTYPHIMGAKIIHLCSLYDDYLGHHVNTNESFENIVTVMGHAASHGVINENLSALFLNNVPIYSVGNRVLLSTGEVATIVECFTGYTDTTRPIVKVESSGQIINLQDVINVTIVGLADENIILEDIVDAQLDEAERRVRR